MVRVARPAGGAGEPKSGSTPPRATADPLDGLAASSRRIYLARPHGPGGHGGRHAQDVRPVPVDQVHVHLAADQRAQVFRDARPFEHVRAVSKAGPGYAAGMVCVANGENRSETYEYALTPGSVPYRGVDQVEGFAPATGREELAVRRWRRSAPCPGKSPSVARPGPRRPWTTPGRTLHPPRASARCASTPRTRAWSARADTKNAQVRLAPGRDGPPDFPRRSDHRRSSAPIARLPSPPWYHDSVLDTPPIPKRPTGTARSRQPVRALAAPIQEAAERRDPATRKAPRAGTTTRRSTDAYCMFFFNDEHWRTAQWRGMFYELPADDLPRVGLFFDDGDAGASIFREWRERFGIVDQFDELRISFVFGSIPGEPAGYSVVLSPDPCPFGLCP